MVKALESMPCKPAQSRDREGSLILMITIGLLSCMSYPFRAHIGKTYDRLDVPVMLLFFTLGKGQIMIMMHDNQSSNRTGIISRFTSQQRSGPDLIMGLR